MQKSRERDDGRWVAKSVMREHTMLMGDAPEHIAYIAPLLYGI
jgi:hypothetical protein